MHIRVETNKKVSQFNVKLSSHDIRLLETDGAAPGLLEKKQKKHSFVIPAVIVIDGVHYTTEYDGQYFQMAVAEGYLDFIKHGSEIKYQDPLDKRMAFRLYRADD